MKATTPRAVGLLLLTVMIPMAVGSAAAYTGQQLARDAKITIDQAREIALHAHPGRITDEELEREHGGSGLRYTFSLDPDSGVQELGVDAVTGQVLENSPD
ncbi:MAG: PepSY domain-containing protein [Methylocella sp.]